MDSLQREKRVNLAIEERCNPDGIFNTLDGLYNRGEAKCVQRTSEKTWCITVRTNELAERLTNGHNLQVNNRPAHATPAGEKVTFVNIFEQHRPVKQTRLLWQDHFTPKRTLANLARMGKWGEALSNGTGTSHTLLHKDRTFLHACEIRRANTNMS